MIYDPAMSIQKIIELSENGHVLICPICHEPLKIVLSRNESLHPGIYCQKDKSHVEMLIEMRPSNAFWNQFKNCVGRPPAQHVAESDQRESPDLDAGRK